MIVDVLLLLMVLGFLGMAWKAEPDPDLPIISIKAVFKSLVNLSPAPPGSLSKISYAKFNPSPARPVAARATVFKLLKPTSIPLDVLSNKKALNLPNKVFSSPIRKSRL